MSLRYYLAIYQTNIRMNTDASTTLSASLRSSTAHCEARASEDSSTLFYPINMVISYDNDIEYRQHFRNLFQMTCNILAVTDDIDDVTQDEWNYEPGVIDPFMDFIYESTKNHPIFQELYLKSAGYMMSTEPSIGIAVLFSYDYLEHFHKVLCDYYHFIDCGMKFDVNVPSVIQLHKKLQR